mgnify:FL=1|jgi:hypothetical protein
MYMKTHTLLSLGLGLMALAPMNSFADEGMWTLYNLPPQVYQTMRGYGFELPQSALYSDADAIKNNVVNFSGYCSGVVVSPDGLVFTNHHCGFEAIRSHSTVEHDYMLHGFIAKSYAEELPNKDMFVSFMKSQQDITARVEALGLDVLSDEAKEKAIDSLAQVLTDSVKGIDSTLHVNIDPFYEGNKWYATTYQDFTDLRLVFTIPKSMGKFGGETDNWMWPRQTCDFSVFRIYADPKTNGPAPYSKDNVPYHPKSWAKVSLDGYKDGSFAMTVGYPGSTERYLSSYGIQEMRDCENEPRYQIRGVKQAVMLKHMRADEAVRIKYDSKFAQSSNYWKNSIGMNKCIDSIGIVNLKRAYEARIRQWQDTAQNVDHKVDFGLLQWLYFRRSALTKALTQWSETFSRRSNIEFNRRALLAAAETEKLSDEKGQYCQFEDNSDQWDAATDADMLAALLKNYREKVQPEFLPTVYATIDKKFKGDYKKYVDYLFKNSALLKTGKLYYNTKAFQKDPGVEYAKSIKAVVDKIQSLGGENKEGLSLSDSIALQERYLCAAKIQMEQDMPHYSDANFTMRLSYGQVGGFDLGGNDSGYYTTAASIVDKMKRGDNGVIDYQAEPVMHELLSANDFGQYTDSVSKTLNLCFLTSNDITGGNSGSPIFDGKGHLIGLAFDGNWDSLSSDINFDKRLARCIGVDIRYVVYMMDRWGHADRLLKEIGVK